MLVGADTDRDDAQSTRMSIQDVTGVVTPIFAPWPLQPRSRFRHHRTCRGRGPQDDLAFVAKVQLGGLYEVEAS